MATSWKKLKIGPREPLTAADIVAYVAEPQPAGDYYSESGVAWLMWHATKRAAARLAIATPEENLARVAVRRTQLEDLIAGVDPTSGKSMRKAGPDGTTVGAIDLCASPAPKSVSVLWALGSNQLRYELETMVAVAVDGAVGRMLDEQPLTRKRFAQGARGVRHEVAEDWVAASAFHTRRASARAGAGCPIRSCTSTTC